MFGRKIIWVNNNNSTFSRDVKIQELTFFLFFVWILSKWVHYRPILLVFSWCNAVILLKLDSFCCQLLPRNLASTVRVRPTRRVCPMTVVVTIARATLGTSVRTNDVSVRLPYSSRVHCEEQNSRQLVAVVDFSPCGVLCPCILCLPVCLCLSVLGHSFPLTCDLINGSFVLRCVFGSDLYLCFTLTVAA